MAKLSKELVDTVAKCLEQGDSHEDAAHEAGITPKTLYHWLAEIKEKDIPPLKNGAKIGVRNVDREKLLSYLSAQYNAARKKYRKFLEEFLLQGAQGGASGDYRAAIFLLQHKYPGSYGWRARREQELLAEQSINADSETSSEPTVHSDLRESTN